MAASKGAATGSGQSRPLDFRLVAMVGVLACIWAAFGIATDGIFLTPRNLYNLSLQVAVVGIMAAGMVLIIVGRQIDLSVGSQLGFIGVAGALIQTEYLPVDGTHTWWIAIVAMLAIGAVIGALNGFLVAYVGIPAFVVTLGGLMFFRNAAYMLNEGRTISPLNDTFRLFGGGLDGSIGATWSIVLGTIACLAVLYGFLRNRGRRALFGFDVPPMRVTLAIVLAWWIAIAAFVWVMISYELPRTEEPAGIAIPVLCLIAVGIVMSAISRKHRFGRHVFSYGGSPESTSLAGIDTRRTILMLFIVMGFLAGVASVVVTARLNAGASVTGTMMELNVIAAAVIGGTSLAGGVGTIVGGLIGALIMQSLESGMILLGVPTPLQRMILASVLILAVWIDMAYRRRVRSND